MNQRSDNLMSASSGAATVAAKAPPQQALVANPAALGRIAVFHLNGVGDMIFSLPALLALRQLFPQAHITSILRPYLQDLLAPIGLVDQIILRPEKSASRETPGFLRELRQANFELAILFSQSLSANVYALLSGAPIRVGFIDTIFPQLLNPALNLRGITAPAKLLYLVEQLGAHPTKRDYVGLLKPNLPQQERVTALLREIGGEKDRLAIISFGEGSKRPYPYKVWAREKHVAVGSYLSRQGLRPVTIGSKGEAPEAALLAEEIGGGAFSLAGRTSLGELAELIGRAEIFIGIDSGPTHIAAALGVPLVAIYGPTDPTITGPQGSNHIILHKPRDCGPCVTPTCEDRSCLAAISAEEVIAAIEQLLGNSPDKKTE
jgi:ADP-heptose:LPS heptosyltransferase